MKVVFVILNFQALFEALPFLPADGDIDLLDRQLTDIVQLNLINVGSTFL